MSEEQTRIETASAGRASAVVIPFPVGPDRLTRALDGLLRACHEQAAAVAGWRAAMTDLRQSVHGLHGSLVQYQEALSQTATQVDTLGQQARALEASLPG